MQTCCNLSIRISTARRIRAPSGRRAQSLFPAVVTVRERYIGKAVVCVHICRNSNVSCKYHRSFAFLTPLPFKTPLFPTQEFVLIAQLFKLHFSTLMPSGPLSKRVAFGVPTIQLIITAAWTLSGHQRRGAEQVPHLHWRRLSLRWPGKGEERHRGQVPRFCQGNLSFCWVQVGRRVPE